MAVELGSNPLTWQQFYEVVYERKKVSLDSSVPGRFGNEETDKSFGPKSRAEALLTLSFLVN